jgi:DNA/RNA endonuclease G (NUC1)
VPPENMSFKEVKDIFKESKILENWKEYVVPVNLIEAEKLDSNRFLENVDKLI